MYAVICDGGDAIKIPCGIDENPEYDCPEPGLLVPFDLCGKGMAGQIVLFAERQDAIDAIRVSHIYNRLWYPNNEKEPYKIVPVKYARREA